MEEKKQNLDELNKVINANSNLQGSKPQILPPRPMPINPPKLPPKPMASSEIKKVVAPEKEVVVPQKEEIKKQKAVKIKKQKVVKEKKPSKIKEFLKKHKLSKKFYFIACGVIVISALILTLILVVMDNVQANAKLSLGDGQVEVVNFDQQYFLEVPVSQDAQCYIFEISENSNEPFMLFSETNQVDVSDYFNKRATFVLRYYIQGANDKTRSDASNSTTFVSKQTLSAPLISYDEETNSLTWSYVENADSYKVYYSNEEKVDFKVYTPVVNNDDHGKANYSLSQLPYGAYNFCVVSVSDDLVYYTPSSQSNNIFVTLYGKQTKVNDAFYSLNEKKLTIDTSNLTLDTYKLKLIIGEQNLEINCVSGQTTYVVNLSEHNIELSLGMSVGVVTVGDGEFILDSDIFVANAVA